MSAPCSVNWYWLLVRLPPIRIGGGFWRKTRMPVTFASCGRSFWMMSSGDWSRSRRGFNVAKTIP